MSLTPHTRAGCHEVLAQIGVGRRPPLEGEQLASHAASAEAALVARP